MGRASVKKNKNMYQQLREELNLTRETASELLESISADRIEKIESAKSIPYPEEILVMANKYKEPKLCNYYCSNDCAIGMQYVPEVKVKDLSQIILPMLASLNSMQKKKELLIEITADNLIDETELKDFIQIQETLEEISLTVEALQIWAEKMVANNLIDISAYNKLKNEKI